MTLQTKIAVFELFNRILDDGDKHFSVDNSIAVQKGLYFKNTNIDPNIYRYVMQKKGIDVFKYNQTLHKSFSVYEKEEKDLIFDQIVHYISTYGLNLDKMYVPAEVLNIPSGELPITIIDTISLPEVKNKIQQIISTNVALHKEQVEYIFKILEEIDHIDINSCKNKELKLKLYHLYGMLPKDPDEFMKYLCYTVTKSPLLIKNEELLILLRRHAKTAGQLLNEYVSIYGEAKLSQCFYRWKNEILALKYIYTSSTINKVSRLSKKHHTLAHKNVLDHIGDYDYRTVIEELNKVNIFKKIKIMNLIQYRQLDNHISFYRIRNHKGFIKESPQRKLDTRILNYLIHDVVKAFAKKVKDKYIKYPEYIDYAIPTSNKAFLGNVPLGTEINLGTHAVIGVHWYNSIDRDFGKEYQTDLDLSLIGNNVKYGWDGTWSSFYSSDDIWFSGDMTNAPRPDGAAEFYYIGKNNSSGKMFSLVLNNFTCRCPVEYSLVVQKDGGAPKEDYIIKNSKSLIRFQDTIQKEEATLGFLKLSDIKKFYVSNIIMSKSIVSKADEKSDLLNKYYEDTFDTMIRFREILSLAGAKFDKPKDKDWDIDLSPQNLSSTAFLDLMEGL